MPGTEQDFPEADKNERARERADVLREVGEHVARKEAQERLRQTRSPVLRRLTQILNLAILAFAAYVWIGNPSWVRVEPPAAPSPQAREAALRLSIYIQAQQIEAYRSENGRIPSSLEEVGPPLAGMHFQQTGRGAYRITGVSDTLTLVYSSSESLAEFMGDSENLIIPSRQERS